MNLSQAISILESHNAWRRRDDDTPNADMQNPTDIGIAIDTVLIAAKEHETEIKLCEEFLESMRK